MKFRFCGELDCPDWILAETAVLSRMSSVRMKLICKQVIADLLGHSISYEKIDKYTTSARMQFAPQDVKAMLAALSFIISSATRHSVAADVLEAELAQLGLPQDICKSICKTWSASLPELTTAFSSRVMSLPRITNTKWRVDYVLRSSDAATVDQPSVRVNLTLDKAPQGWAGDARVAKDKQIAFEADAEGFAVLLNELKHARAVLSSLEGQ